MDGDIQQVCYKDAGPRACMQYGTVEIEGPDGSWVGTWDAMFDGTFTRLPTWMALEGTGAYDGRSYWLFTPSQWDPKAEASGIIYEGPPPPWADTLPLTPAT